MVWSSKMSSSTAVKISIDGKEDAGHVGVCTCVLRKAKAVNLKAYLVCVVLFSVLLLLFTSKHLGHGTLVQDYVKHNVTVDQLLVNITETKDPGLLLLLIHASGREIGKQRREAIRDTWISPIETIAEELGREITYKFVLGSFNMSAATLRNLTLENKIYQDMIFLPEVPDTHDTLTQRTLQGFQYYVHHSMDYEYILKCDDDTFINLRTIANELKEMNGEGRLYWGEFQGAANLLFEGPYAEWCWYQCDSYVPYAYGGGYILSRDLVELMAMNAPYLTHYNNEDVSVGAWLAPYSLRHRHDARFNTGADSRGCKRQYIVSHKVSAEQMYSYYASLTRDGYYCSRKNRWYGWRGHTYNWKRLPSKCCRQSRRIP